MKTTRKTLLALPIALVVAVGISSPAGATTLTPASAAPTPTVAPAQTTQGIIMRDGGVCDPIRHMGC
jgi:hypothetical protein